MQLEFLAELPHVLLLLLPLKVPRHFHQGLLKQLPVPMMNYGRCSLTTLLLVQDAGKTLAPAVAAQGNVEELALKSLSAKKSPESLFVLLIKNSLKHLTLKNIGSC